MKLNYPPAWLERALIRAVPPRNRESIAGDLLEAYSGICQTRGPLLAKLWYARQLFSFGPAAVLRALALQPVLALTCLFTALAGSWLGAMDVILHHRNIAGREAIAGTIVLQSVLTLIMLRHRRTPALCWTVLTGSAAITGLAAVAFHGLLTSTDFEGYILVIALALLFQAILTVLTLYHGRDSEPRMRVQ